MSRTIEEVRILGPHHKGDEDWHLGWDAWTRLNEAMEAQKGSKTTGKRVARGKSVRALRGITKDGYHGYHKLLGAR